MSILESIGNIFKALAAWCGYAQHRSELRNSTEVRQSAEAQLDVDQVNRIEHAVAQQDVDSVRQDLAE